MQRVRIRGNRQLVEMLKLLKHRAAVDEREGQNRLFLEFEGAVEREEAAFRQVLDAIDRLNLAYASLETRKMELAKQLQVTIRDFYQVLKLRTNRLGHAATTQALYYPRGHQTRAPKSARQEVWQEMGKYIIQADAKAVARGLPAMQNPAASDIATLLIDTERARHELFELEDKRTQLQADLETRRVAADELIREVASSMERSLKKLGPAKKRRVMRSYGFRFKRARKP